MAKHSNIPRVQNAVKDAMETPLSSGYYDKKILWSVAYHDLKPLSSYRIFRVYFPNPILLVFHLLTLLFFLIRNPISLIDLIRHGLTRYLRWVEVWNTSFALRQR